MRSALVAAVTRVIAGVTLEPPSLSPDDKSRLIELARLAVRSRSAVERDSYHREITLVPRPEAPARLAAVLAQLFRGLNAVGVPHSEAWRVLIKTALDSMPAIRRAAFDFLATRPSSELVQTAAVLEHTPYKEQTMRRVLEDLAVHRVLDRKTHGKMDRWALSQWAREGYERASGVVPETSRDPLSGWFHEMSDAG